jgi:hypothetical protein
MNFTDYLTESADLASKFAKAKEVASLIKSAQQRERFLESLSELEAAAKAQEVYNARFNEAKTSVIRRLEYAYQNLFDGVKDQVIAAEEPTSDLWSLSAWTDIKKLDKAYKSMKNFKDPKVSDFFDAIRDLPDAMKMMKPYVKSGRPPKEPKPGQFVKPIASSAASKIAANLATQVSEKFTAQLKKSLTETYTSAYKRVKDITNPKDLPRTGPETAIASMVFIVRGFGKNKTIELKPNASALVERYIEDVHRNIVEQYIAKNTAKLALILQKKGEPSKSTLNRAQASRGAIESSLTLTFKDDSQFTMETSIVYKYSTTGKPFVQYPARFTNVVLADGTKMKTPSEEKMIKEF